MGIDFEIDDNKGPLIEDPILTMGGIGRLHALELERLQFVGK